MQYETFPALTNIDGVSHAFTRRTECDGSSTSALTSAFVSLRLPPDQFVSAEQPHDNFVAVVDDTHRGSQIATVDALITSVKALPLVIRCADCAAIYIINTRIPAIGLIHSGKKGTLGNIVSNTVKCLQHTFDAHPKDCVAFISPCIGPCHYELNLWDTIEKQLNDAGINQVWNQRICTACHLDRYFSYRAEHGNTGRMYAILSLNTNQ